MRTNGLVGMLLFASLVTLPASAGATPDWDTYGFSPTRAAINTAEHKLTRVNAGSLHQRWEVRLGEGNIETQPLVAFDVHMSGGTTRDIVYAGTSRGQIAAVDANDGTRIWSRKFGSIHDDACNSEYGIQGTPVIDRNRDSIFFVDGRGQAYELSMTSGKTIRHWSITTHPNREQVWSALTLSRGVVYIPTSGLCDYPPYHGRIVAIDTGSGKVLATWYTNGRHGPSGGAIWGWAGISTTSSGSWLFAATGNSVDASEHSGLSERVVRLTPYLHVHGSNYPGLPKGDADFGATPLPFQAHGCPAQLAVENKYGQMFVYDRSHIPHGPIQRIQLGGAGDGTHSLLGSPAFWRAKRLLYLSNPGTRGRYKAGFLAFRVTGHCRLKLAWQATGPSELDSTPTVAGGVVYYGEGFENDLVALNALTGKRLWSSGSALLHYHAVFAAPTVVGGRLYAGAFDGTLHALEPATAAGQR
jgi:outer membrane protein assembly factor BamB